MAYDPEMAPIPINCVPFERLDALVRLAASMDCAPRAAAWWLMVAAAYLTGEPWAVEKWERLFGDLPPEAARAAAVAITCGGDPDIAIAAHLDDTHA